MCFCHLERREEGGRGAPGWTERATQKFAENSSSKRARENPMPITLITVSSGFFLSVETFCVNGRAHATARRRFLSHFPGNDEPRVGAFAYDCAPTSS